MNERLSLQIEVNVASFVMTADGKVHGGNIVDLTMGFGAGVIPPGREVTDRETNLAMTNALAPVLAAIRIAVTSLGFAYIGQLPERVMTHATPTGETAVTPEVRVIMPMGDGPEHRA